MEVVDTDESESKNFLCLHKMAKVGAREILARIAVTALLDRGTVFRVGGIFEINCPTRSECGAIPRQSGGKDAVKHIDSASDHFDDLGRGSQAHCVAGVVVWQEWDSAFDGAKHLFLGFADADPSDGVAVKSNIHKSTGTFFPEVRVG